MCVVLVKYHLFQVHDGTTPCVTPSLERAGISRAPAPRRPGRQLEVELPRPATLLFGFCHSRSTLAVSLWVIFCGDVRPGCACGGGCVKIKEISQIPRPPPPRDEN